MATSEEHYKNFLAHHYSWMSGGKALKVEEYRAFFRDQAVRPLHSHVAVDLGAGPGFQAIPLAEIGFKVIAIDLSHELLAELRENAHGLPIEIVEDDLLRFGEHSPAQVDLIVCMGDTLIHLPSREDVQSLLESAYHALTEQGLLILRFRDMTRELTGLDRFIPVRSDEQRIFTCFLEYEEHHVKVHDILYEKIGDQWQMRKSFFRKLRVSPHWVNSCLLATGFHIRTCDVEKGLVTIVAGKP